MVARYLWAASYFQLKTKGRIYRNDEISFSFQAPNANEFYCATDELLIMSPNITILRDGAVYGSQVGNFAETMLIPFGIKRGARLSTLMVWNCHRVACYRPMEKSTRFYTATLKTQSAHWLTTI